MYALIARTVLERQIQVSLVGPRLEHRYIVFVDHGKRLQMLR